MRGLGEYRGGKVVGVVSALPVSIADAEVGIVGKQLRDLNLKGEVREVDSFGPGNYCYVRLNYERCSIVFSAVGTHEKSRKAVAHEVVRQVCDFLQAGKACEKHLADQLLVPLNVFVGRQFGHERWAIDIQKETLHYETNREVVMEFGLDDW